MSFCVQNRMIQFYETDLMGIVHHSNYVRLFEEARVHWALAKNLIRADDPASASQFAVLKVEVRHLKTLRFAERIDIELQVRREGARVVFAYKMWNQLKELVATARTEHANLGPDLKPRKLPIEFVKTLESEPWTETWL